MNDVKMKGICVVAIAENSLGQILLSSRKTNPDDFGLIGGKVEPGDGSPVQALYREVKEETGLDILRAEFFYETVRKGWLVKLFICEVEDKIPSTDEYIVAKWGSWEEALKGCFGAYNRLTYDRYLRYKAGGVD